VTRLSGASEFYAEHHLRRCEGRPIPGTPATVAGALVEAASRQLNIVALADRRRQLTYAELAVAADRAATAYGDAGLRSLDSVAVSLPNTIDVVVSFLGAMRAGLLWVGINTHLAPPEKAFMLEDSGASLLLAEARTLESLSVHGTRVERLEVEIEKPGAWWDGASEHVCDLDTLDPFAPAAIAYTSGTTGRPKGVVHSQHNMLMPAAAITRAVPRPLVQGVSLPLTILNMQILGPVQSILCGGVCVPMDRVDVGGVAEWVSEFAIQRMYSTPPTVYDLLTRDDIDPSALASLTHLGVGGAKCPNELRERYRQRFGRDFVFGYGLTEAPTAVTGYVEEGEVAPLGSSGRARDYVSITVRDENGDVLETGTEGEICVGATSEGPLAGCYTTMLGYWDRPEATDAALRGGVLHTGDVGVIDADGMLWVRDRRSELIIRGGANVYPAEVERVLEALPEIAEAAVVGREHPRLGEEVVAFVAFAPGSQLEPQKLTEACLAELAAYKAPVAWYAVAQFPRNAMGKVVKPRLREWLAADEPTDGNLAVRRL